MKIAPIKLNSNNNKKNGKEGIMTKQRANVSLAGIALLLIAATLAAQVTEEWVSPLRRPGKR
jgi:hypothetical protein